MPAIFSAPPRTRYAVRGLRPAAAAEIRRTRRAPGYGHPAHAEVGDERAPCRVCLGHIEPGERRLLVTHDPFADAGTHPLPGPVFVHERECRPFAGAGLPPVLRDGARTIQAYGADRRLLDEQRVEGAEAVAGAIDWLLADADVTYLHVRSTGAGCWLAAVERRP